MGQIAAVAIFTFWTAFFTALTLNETLFRRRKDSVLERLERIAKPEQSQERILVSQSEEASSGLKAIREKLLLAGLKRKSDLEKFLLFQRLCYTAPLIGSAIAYFSLGASTPAVLLSGILAGAVFIVLPRFWLRHMMAKRREEIQRCLPDTLDLFVVALDAGLSFDGALVRVAEEQRRVSTHISREFLYTNQQISVGKSREDALRSLARRTGVEEMDSLVQSILQSNKLGMSLVKTLRAQADAIRKKRKQFIHGLILKAPVKLVFPLLFFVFPTLMIVILAPSLMKIFQHLSHVS